MLRNYLKTIFKPSVAKRAKAMKRAKRARSTVREELRKRRLAPLEQKLGYSFKDKTILQEALNHPSLVGAVKTKVRSNQRLEFLGDAILQSVISSLVFNEFESSEEGELTKIRSALTRGSFLTKLSKNLGIPEFLVVPKASEDIRGQDSAAEDAFEAVVGAIYLDSDFKKVREILLGWYRLALENIPEIITAQNPKGALQEAAAKNGATVSYKLLGQSGPDHQKVFEVEVQIDGKAYCRASASSKKHAEAAAAASALKIYSETLGKNSGGNTLKAECAPAPESKGARKDFAKGAPAQRQQTKNAPKGKAPQANERKPSSQ